MNTRSKSARPVILLVHSDDEDRDHYTTWLREDGFDVLECSGPDSPRYTCVGSRSGACPLAARADAIILDSTQPGDVVGEGTSASDLATLYASMGKPVLGMATLAREAPPQAEWVRWPASRADLLLAVRRKLEAQSRQRPPARMAAD